MAQKSEPLKENLVQNWYKTGTKHEKYVNLENFPDKSGRDPDTF